MKTKVPALDCIYYAIQTSFIFLGTSLITNLLFGFTGVISSSGGPVTNKALFVILLIIGQYVLPFCIQLLFLRSKPSEHYLEGKGLLWLRSSLKYILPGEAFRILLCILPTTLTIFGRLFYFGGYIMYMLGYLTWFPERQSSLSRILNSADTIDMFDRIIEGKLIFSDILGYIATHVVLILPYIVMLIITYRLFWRKREKELKEMKSEHHI